MDESARLEANSGVKEKAKREERGRFKREMVEMVEKVE